METLEFEFKGKQAPAAAADHALAGVVSSGNLEVLIEKADLAGSMRIVVNTAAWGRRHVASCSQDFSARHPLGDVLITDNDAGATPAVVSPRLDQAVKTSWGCCMRRSRISHGAVSTKPRRASALRTSGYRAEKCRRVRVTSPHLPKLDARALTALWWDRQLDGQKC
jgi:malonate decarboxylase delta subunit